MLLYLQLLAAKLSIIRSGFLCPNESKVTPNTLKSEGIIPANNIADCVVTEPYAGNLTLQCVSDLPLPSDVTLVWFKNTTIVRTDRRINVYGSNHLVLNFTSVLPNDAGHYQCRAVKKNEDVKRIINSPGETSAIEIRVLPYVKNAFKDVAVVEQKTLSLTCIVLSTVPTTVKWVLSTFEGKLKKNYSQSEGRIILSNVNSSTNAMLLITSVNMSLDRGKYECVVESAVGPSPTNTTFMVRIKSKYAVLWPFIGICAEVFILCTIILIYEKKRDKSKIEESDTDQGPEMKSSPNRSHDGILYRK
ncbi:hypothetical protein V9T40_009280 [Parthenolecanium corni]|uniref:Ig-like domain-containing protein n=1 Tax=Parthenolecanium corni TaxID=536013 RepID=A0AAN9TME1_9HEMI